MQRSAHAPLPFYSLTLSPIALRWSMAKQPITLDELADIVHAGFKEMSAFRRDMNAFRRETSETFKSVGDHLVRIENRLEDIPTRGELGELFKKFYDTGVINTRLERLEKHLGLEVITTE